MECNKCEDQPSITLLIDELIELLRFYFQQNWFLLFLEDIPGKKKDMYDLSCFLSLKKFPLHDKHKLSEIIDSLDHFVQVIHRFLLPVLREKLGISGLTPDKQIKNIDERVRNGFIASVFPDNLNRLSRISGELKSYLMDNGDYSASLNRRSQKPDTPLSNYN